MSTKLNEQMKNDYLNDESQKKLKEAMTTCAIFVGRILLGLWGTWLKPMLIDFSRQRSIALTMCWT
jgi:hypothetical protein